MKFSAVAAITNNLIAARFWMILALLFAGMAVAAPYFTAMAMRAREKVRHPRSRRHSHLCAAARLRGGGRAARLSCPACLSRALAAAMYQARNPEFKQRQIHQKVEVTKIDILDTRQIKDGPGHSYESVTVRTEGNLIRTGTLNKMEFREPVKFTMEFLFIRNRDLLGNGRLPLVVQDFKYKETPL